MNRHARMRPLHDGQLGASLLEILIAMMMIFVTLLGLAGLSVVAHSGMSASQKMTRAVTLAQEKVEDVRRQGISSQAGLPLSFVEPYGSLDEAPNHQRILTITPDRPKAGLHSVTVTMQWDQGAHSTSLTTFLLE